MAASYLQDEKAQKLLAKLTIQSPFDSFSLRDGLIRYKDRIWLGNSNSLQAKITRALHDGAVGDILDFMLLTTGLKSCLPGRV